MEVKDYLLDEMKRLNRRNDSLEKSLNNGAIKDEPEQIVSNVKAMCQIASTVEFIKNI